MYVHIPGSASPCSVIFQVVLDSFVTLQAVLVHVVYIFQAVLVHVVYIFLVVLVQVGLAHVVYIFLVVLVQVVSYIPGSARLV